MKASVCSTYDSQGARFAGFGADPDGSEYVVFSITLEPDEQDRALGLDGLHVEINGEGNSGYDKVDRIVASPHGLTVCPKAQGDPLQIDLGASTDVDETLAALKTICDKAGIAFEDKRA